MFYSHYPRLIRVFIKKNTNIESRNAIQFFGSCKRNVNNANSLDDEHAMGFERLISEGYVS